MTKSVYDTIGQSYDATRRADPHLTRRLLDNLAWVGGSWCLDLARGTGNYARALASTGMPVVGLDVSVLMAGAAVQKGQPVELGSAAELPFAKNAFAAAVCILSLHHLNSTENVFAELWRVLHSGRAVLFSSSPQQMVGYWLNEYFPQSMRAAIKSMPSIGETCEKLAAAGFSVIGTEPYTVRENLEDLFLYSKKHDPQAYLDPRIRAGISLFARPASVTEIDQGLERLKADIESGQIDRVLAKFKNDRGDYTFVTAEKIVDPA